MRSGSATRVQFEQGSMMARKQTQLTSPEGGIAFGIVLIILAIVIIAVPASQATANSGWAGVLGIPIWILGIPVLLGGIWLLYLGVAQRKKNK
jgi:uncharacterized BrkB/YihY/UPF0761 family membrane protein